MSQTPVFDGPRLIRREDMPGSHRLLRLCFGDAPGGEELPSESAVEAASTDAEVEAGSEETYLFADQGKPVSQISIFFTPLKVLDGMIRVGNIGGVCTHPDYRGYRLASRLMGYCTRKLVEGGASLMVISGGRGLYTRLGNAPTGKYAAFPLRAGQTAAAPANIRLRKAEPGNAALCGRLYQAEAVHFTRAPGRFERAFGPHELGFRAEEWLVELDGQPSAYLLLSIPWEFIGQPEAGVRRIAEYAGSRVAVAGAIAAALAQPGIREIETEIPWQDTDLIHWLGQAFGQPEWVPLREHTMRIINFPALMEGLQPYVTAILPESVQRDLSFEQSGPLLAGDGDGLCAIAYGEERLECSTADMTRLVLGDPEGKLGQVKTAGKLGEVIKALFPLPSFLPGLDYR